MKIRLCHVAMATVVAATLLFKVSSRCAEGQVRLVGGSGPHEGKVEVCLDHKWGAVHSCGYSDWDDDDAKVVCRQLGYVPERAQALSGEDFGQESVMKALESGECNPSIHCTLLQCPRHQNHDRKCDMLDVGVKCEQKIVKNISAANVTNPYHNTLNTVLINVTLVNNISTNLFQVECYNQQHGVYVNISVNNEMNSFTTHLRGLLPSSFYTCCTLAISKDFEYHQQCVSRGTCISIKTPKFNNSTSNPVDSRISNQTESKALISVSIVGGILGFVLLILLIALVCLLIPKRRRSSIVDLSQNSSTLPVDQNLRYAMIPSSQATAGTYAHVGRSTCTRQEETNESAPNYSRLGPAYVTVDQGRQEDNQNQISTNVRERYEFAEIHNMETDRQDFGHEDYSHLKH